MDKSSETYEILAWLHQDSLVMINSRTLLVLGAYGETKSVQTSRGTDIYHPWL